MLFKDRQGTNLNRKRISIVSQTPNEIIADIVRADNPTEEGTEINASTFNGFQAEINSANEKSDNAITIASSANSTSKEAKTIADNASTKADSAVTTANTALSNASNALTTANESLSNSEDAVEISSDASFKADSAITTSNNAETKAANALLSANSANETANSALANSQTAIDNSVAAKNTALKVEAALADRGATVTIAGVPQSEVAFTTDPQTQLNKKIDNSFASIRESVLSVSYPIGAIYLSVSPINPSELFGGTWEQLKDKFLIGASDNYPVSSIGGETQHKLTIAEMPTHSHGQRSSISATQSSHSHGLQSSTNYSTNCNGLARNGTAWKGDVYQVGGVANNNEDELYCYQAGNNKRYVTNETPTITVSHNISILDSGEGLAHNNMPPYMAVYMWKRIG